MKKITMEQSYILSKAFRDRLTEEIKDQIIEGVYFLIDPGPLGHQVKRDQGITIFFICPIGRQFGSDMRVPLQIDQIICSDVDSLIAYVKEQIPDIMKAMYEVIISIREQCDAFAGSYNKTYPTLLVTCPDILVGDNLEKELR